MTATEEVILTQIKKMVRRTEPAASERLTIDDRMQSGQVLDSLGVIDLTMYLEDVYNVRFSFSDTMIEFFDTVRQMANVVDQKRLEAAKP